MHKVLVASIAVCSAIAAPGALAQNFPNRPIELVVPLAPGSTTDVAARLLAQHASATLGAQIVVVNKSGAGILLGTMAVAKAPPDGYTILMATVGIVVDKILKPATSYDAERDFAPITLAVTAPMVLLVSPKLGVGTLQEFLTKYRDAKDLTFSSGGAGTLPHVAGELLSFKSGIPIRHVPYRGGAPALQDVVAGIVGMNFGTPLTKGNIDNGDVRALAWRRRNGSTPCRTCRHSRRRACRYRSSMAAPGSACWRRPARRKMSCKSSASISTMLSSGRTWSKAW